MDRYVKLDAIKAIAKPMAAFHGKDAEEESHMAKCPKCGHEYAMDEDEDEYED